MLISNNLTRKEREKLQRKEEILNAAIELFANKGYNPTTLEDIALKAEFGIGTIYNYFENKEEILRSIVANILETSYESIAHIDEISGDFHEFLYNHIYTAFHRFIKSKESLIILVSYFTNIGEIPFTIQSDAFCEINKKIEDIIARRISTALANEEIKEVDPFKFHCYIESICLPYLMMVIKYSKEEIDLDSNVKFVLDILYNGIKK